MNKITEVLEEIEKENSFESRVDKAMKSASKTCKENKQ